MSFLQWLAFVCFLFYDSKSTKDQQFSEHLFLILNSTLGMALMVMSNNLIVTFVSMETHVFISVSFDWVE